MMSILRREPPHFRMAFHASSYAPACPDDRMRERNEMDEEEGMVS